jgi:manganese transport protein
MVPALVAIALGVDPLKVLVFSQVLLSFQLPFTILPLLMFTSRGTIMGECQNCPFICIIAYAVAAIVLMLNAILLMVNVAGSTASLSA